MLKEEYTINEIEILLSEMRRIQNENPKAKVIYDTQREKIYISFPLPSDFTKIRGFKLTKVIKDEFKF